MRYRIFDYCLTTDLNIPELPTFDSEVDPSKEILVTFTGTGALFSGPWVHEWLAGQELEARLAINQGIYIFQIPNQADFCISEDLSSIQVVATTNTEAETLVHLLVDQAIPRVVAHRGELILHAAGVVTESGRGVLLLGNSGVGKSTLAAALRCRGFEILSDDCMAVRSCDGGVMLLPSYPGLRLHRDCPVPPAGPGYWMGDFTAKYRYPVDAAGIQQAPCNTIFCLTNPNTMDTVDTQSLALQLMNQIFVLDPTKQMTAVENLARINDLASSCSIHSLCYEHSDSGLENTIQQLVTNLQ